MRLPISIVPRKRCSRVQAVDAKAKQARDTKKTDKPYRRIRLVLPLKQRAEQVPKVFVASGEWRPQNFHVRLL